jgi:hypothetical protein
MDFSFVICNVCMNLDDFCFFLLWIRKIGVGGVNIWKTVTGEVSYQQNFVEMLSMICK